MGTNIGRRNEPAEWSGEGPGIGRWLDDVLESVVSSGSDLLHALPAQNIVYRSADAQFTPSARHDETVLSFVVSCGVNCLETVWQSLDS